MSRNVDRLFEDIGSIDQRLRQLDPDSRDDLLKRIAPMTKNRLLKSAWWGLIQVYAGNSEAHRSGKRRVQEMKTYVEFVTEARRGKKWDDWSMKSRDDRDANGNPIPQAIYWGRREAMNAEVSTPLFYPGKYLVQPVGEHTWDAEGADNIGHVRTIIREWKRAYPNIRIFAV